MGAVCDGASGLRVNHSAGRIFPRELQGRTWSNTTPRRSPASLMSLQRHLHCWLRQDFLSSFPTRKKQAPGGERLWPCGCLPEAPLATVLTGGPSWTPSQGDGGDVVGKYGVVVPSALSRGGVGAGGTLRCVRPPGPSEEKARRVLTGQTQWTGHNTTCLQSRKDFLET